MAAPIQKFWQELRRRKVIRIDLHPAGLASEDIRLSFAQLAEQRLGLGFSMQGHASRR